MQPDYAPGELYLIFPDGIASRQHLCDLYLHLIDHVPEKFSVILFVTDLARFRRDFEPRLARGVEAFEAAFSDIWLGDYFPLCYPEGTFTFRYAEYQRDQDLLLAFMAEEPIDVLPIRLDLGAFEMVSDVLLLSKDVYTGNVNENDPTHVDRILTEYFAHSRVVLLDPGTRLNHIDTLFRVVDDIVLYNPHYVTDEMLAEVKTSVAGKDHRFHELRFELSGEVNDRDEDFIESYVGNAFDFIKIGGTILFPVINAQDRRSMDKLKGILEAEGHEKEIVVLEHPDLEALYSLGGGLFCISGIY